MGYLQYLDISAPSNEVSEPLPLTTLSFLCTSFTLLYVLPFYLSPATRPSPTLTRDSDFVIRARVRSVTISCIISALATTWVLSSYGSSPWEAVQAMGWWPINILDVGKCLGLTMLLFAGSLFEKGLVEQGLWDWARLNGVKEGLSSWIGWRHYVAGPMTEELLFRSLLLPLSLLTSLRPGQTLLYTPLYFGIAHAHHAYEFSLTHPHTPLVHILLRSLFQFVYTTLFGWYASFLFLRTGSAWGCVIVHSFCNWMGLPRFWGRMEREVVREVFVRGEGEGDHEQGRMQWTVVDDELGVWWTMAYYVLLALGVWGFWRGLWVLTESDNRLVDLQGSVY